MKYHARTVSKWRALVLAASITGSAFGQTLVTDKSDYLPGEITYFAATGFAPGEDISMSLKVVSQDHSAIDYALGGLSADSNGEFTAAWVVPPEALNTVITSTAIGMSSRRVARVVFYDGLWTTPYDISMTSDGEYINLSLSVVYHGTPPYYPSDNRGAPVVSLVINDVWHSYRMFYASATTWYDRRFTLSVFVGSDKTVSLRMVRNAVWARSFFDYTYYGASTYTATTSPSQPCLINAAPALQVDDLDLGAIVGCLEGGQFVANSSVIASDFGVSAVDPDGDPVDVTFNGPYDFEWVGPGEATATVSFTATDDPSGRQAESSCPLVSEQITTEATVSVQITYVVEGPLAPLTSGVALLKKKGRVIPMKYRLRDCNGVELCPANLPALADEANMPQMDAIVTSAISPDGDAPVEDPGSSMNNELIFRYTGDCGADGHWQYNLSTKGPGWTKGLLYTASILLDDETTHELYFALK
ncbi:MAG: hypothetical protein ACI82F_004043 [Planctomycetota bacterium]|jgi:hypothetical protein